MKQIIILALSFMIMAANCKKEGDCHGIINFNNQYDKDVLFALRFTDINGNCVLNGEKVNKKESFNWRPYNSCIEDHLIYEEPLEIYIIDSEEYNDPMAFYECDSIALKNKILKQYSLTLEDLKQSNFTLTFP